MKVLFVCPFVPWPLVNGGKIRTFNLIREASAHAEIHLRLVREDEQAEDAEESLAPHCASLRVFERERPSSWKRLMRPKLERWFHSPALNEAVRRELLEEDFQLVHLDELLLARILPPGRRVPVVQHHHKLDTVLYDSLSLAAGPQRHFDLYKLRRLEAESTRRYRNHLFCSWDDADILRERYGALDCAVVQSGFDPELFQPTAPPVTRDPDRIVFLGSMDYGPNVDGVTRFAAETLPLLRQRYPDLRFDIVGGNPVPEIQALAGDDVNVTGQVPDVRPYLERASAMVVPLAIGGGTRLKIVEALALATPTISTTIGAEGLGLAHDEHILLADDAASFADAVGRVLGDSDQARALGERGRAFVHGRYRWQALAQELVEYWERIAFSGTLSPSR